MTAKADKRYHTLLQLAAGRRFFADMAALNITYTASVAAVDRNTPSDNQGSMPICHTVFTSEVGVSRQREHSRLEKEDRKSVVR
jgi:hypothetical protein